MTTITFDTLKFVERLEKAVNINRGPRFPRAARPPLSFMANALAAAKGRV